MSKLPWLERVTMLSIHPDAASRSDVARMASDLVEVERAHEIVRRFVAFIGRAIDPERNDYPEGWLERLLPDDYNELWAIHRDACDLVQRPAGEDAKGGEG